MLNHLAPTSLKGTVSCPLFKLEMECLDGYGCFLELFPWIEDVKVIESVLTNGNFNSFELIILTRNAAKLAQFLLYCLGDHIVLFRLMNRFLDVRCVLHMSGT